MSVTEASAISTVSATPQTRPDRDRRRRTGRAGAGPPAHPHPVAGGITVLSNRDDAPKELLELAALPQVSVRFGQPASFIDAPPDRRVTTADGLEFNTTSW